MKNAKPMKLNDLLLTKLQALYDIENEIVKALPKMIDEATDRDLKAAFSSHLEETKMQVDRLESIFLTLDVKPKKLKVEGIRGIIDDAKWVMKNVSGGTALDANLIASAEYVEFYEMAGYGSAIEWARMLDLEDVALLLEESLNEERGAADTLTTLAVSRLNQEALGSAENTDEDDML